MQAKCRRRLTGDDVRPRGHAVFLTNTSQMRYSAFLQPGGTTHPV